MDCLTGLLSLSKYCGLPLPKSGVYLETLPGISTEMAQKITDGDRTTFSDLWQAIETQSGHELKDDILLFLEEKVNFNESLYHTKKPVIDMASIATPAATEQRGIYIELPYGKHIRLHLKGVWIDVDAIGSVIIKVKDAHTGASLDELDKEVIAGYQYVEIGRFYNARKIEISFDGTGFASRFFQQNEDELLWSGHPDIYFYDCHNTCCHDTDIVRIYPVLNGAMISHAMGIWPDCEVICSVESFICEHKHKFTQALKNKFGEKLMDHKLASSRLNFFTTSNLEYTRENQAKYQARYEQLLKAQLQRINLEQEGICFDCHDKFEVTTGWARL